MFPGTRGNASLPVGVWVSISLVSRGDEIIDDGETILPCAEAGADLRNDFDIGIGEFADAGAQGDAAVADEEFRAGGGGVGAKDVLKTRTSVNDLDFDN